MAVADALAQGYEPCKVCKPGELDYLPAAPQTYSVPEKQGSVSGETVYITNTGRSIIGMGAGT